MKQYLRIAIVLFVIAILGFLLMSCPSQEEEKDAALLPYMVFYDTIKTPCDDYLVIDFGQLSVHLFCSDEMGRREYKKRHGVDILSTAGVMWNNGKDYEVWSHMTKLPNGRYTPNIVTLGHEIAHAIDRKLNHEGFAFGNPDEVFTK